MSSAAGTAMGLKYTMKHIQTSYGRKENKRGVREDGNPALFTSPECKDSHITHLLATLPPPPTHLATAERVQLAVTAKRL